MSKKTEKPVMLGARISPKAQYGLRLLAKIQGRTIADAVEWAINLALRSTRVGGGITGQRLATIVDEVWDEESEPRQIFYLDETAPELLDFEQRSAWAMVRRCHDLWHHRYFDYVENADPELPPTKEETSPETAAFHEDAPNFELIEKHWPAIRDAGVQLVQLGDLETTFTLDDIVNGEVLSKAGIKSP